VVIIIYITKKTALLSEDVAPLNPPKGDFEYVLLDNLFRTNDFLLSRGRGGLGVR
jgi:hypothetical protein